MKSSGTSSCKGTGVSGCWTQVMLSRSIAASTQFSMLKYWVSSNFQLSFPSWALEVEQMGQGTYCSINRVPSLSVAVSAERTRENEKQTFSSFLNRAVCTSTLSWWWVRREPCVTRRWCWPSGLVNLGNFAWWDRPPQEQFPKWACPELRQSCSSSTVMDGYPPAWWWATSPLLTSTLTLPWKLQSKQVRVQPLPILSSSTRLGGGKNTCLHASTAPCILDTDIKHVEFVVYKTFTQEPSVNYTFLRMRSGPRH